MVRALRDLPTSERAGLAMALNGQSPTRLAATLPGSPHAASQAAHRAGASSPPLSRTPLDTRRRPPSGISRVLGARHRRPIPVQSPEGCRSTNPAGPVPTVLHRGPVDGGLGGLPSPAAVSK